MILCFWQLFPHVEGLCVEGKLAQGRDKIPQIIDYICVFRVRGMSESEVLNLRQRIFSVAASCLHKLLLFNSP